MSDSLHTRAFYNTIARYYDGENAELVEDLEMYTELAGEVDGTILDVGCGSGRVSLHLASQGITVVGIDSSSVMLERGRQRAKGRVDLRDNVTFLEGDALSYTYPQKYEMILFAYNCLMHFKTLDDQRQLLTHLTNFLTDDGVMIIDLPNAGETYTTNDDGAITLERSFIEPESGNLVMQQSTSRLDRAMQLLTINWIYDEIMPDSTLKRTLAPLTLRYIYAAELDLLLQVCGLKRVERYGEYDQSPFEDGCDRLIAIAKKL